MMLSLQACSGMVAVSNVSLLLCLLETTASERFATPPLTRSPDILRLVTHALFMKRKTLAVTRTVWVYVENRSIKSGTGAAW